MKIFGKQFIDWGNLHQVAESARKEKILEAISLGLKSIAAEPLQMVSAAKFVGADPTLLRGAPPIIMVGTDTVNQPDRGYEALFALVDMLNSTSKTFEIASVTGGVTFYQVAPGEEAKLSKLPSAGKVDVGMLRFIGGFAILDDWLRFNELYKIDDLTRDTITRWYDQKANLFYGLLTALAAGVNQAFDTDDVTTINKACAQILVDMEAAGYAVSAASQFYITCHPTLLARIYKALAAVFTNPNANNNQIVYNIAGVIPTAKIASTSYYVTLPGIKAKRGEWENLNTRPAQRNELVLGADHVWTGAYNGAIAETKQFRRCSLS
jgi:hypothetical protein